MKVSKAQKSDIPEIIKFNINMAMETENKKLDEQTVTKGVHKVFSSPSLGYYIIVKDPSGILGCLMITYEWSDWRNGLFWWIQSVYVKKEYRRKGVFRKMYNLYGGVDLKKDYIIKIEYNDGSSEYYKKKGRFILNNKINK